MCPDMVTGDYVMSLTGVHTVNFILESAQPAEIEPAYLSIASCVTFISVSKNTRTGTLCNDYGMAGMWSVRFRARACPGLHHPLFKISFLCVSVP